MKVDLHVHTCYSPDSRSRLEDIVEHCRRIDIGCLAITDHGTIEGALRMKSIAPFPVIVSEEVMSTGGEIIGYFLNEEIPSGLAPVEVMERIKQQGGLVGLPHPFDKMGRHPLKAEFRDVLLEYIDIIEVFNARSLRNNFSNQALRFAQKNGFLQSAGSDAHSVSEVGNAYVEVPEFEFDPQSFKAALAEGRIRGRKNSMKNRIATILTTMPKRVRYRLNV